MPTKRPQVVILGGGFAGLTTARQLVKSGAVETVCDVTIIDTDRSQVYTPWLYEAATGAVRGESTEIKQDMLKAAGISFVDLPGYAGVRFVQAQIEGLDIKSRHVQVSGKRRIPYDILVVALGAEPNYFDIPGLPANALVLKRLTDADKIQTAVTGLFAKASARAPKYIVVAGAGPNGIELVAELANTIRMLERRSMLQFGAIKLSLLDPAPQLFGILPESLRVKAIRRLEELGVALLQGLRVSEVGVGFVKAFTASGKQGDTVTLPTDLCIWSAGVRVNTLVGNLPFPRDERGRIKLESSYLVAGQTHIFAAGDCAAMINPYTGKADPQSAQVAHFQAHDLAKNILRLIKQQSLKPAHLPKRWAFFSALGGRYAVGTLGGVRFAGRLAFMLRRISDLYYFLAILPLRSALRLWLKGVNLYRKNDR